ncbi:MAG TPA: SpoIID/LytB domain-containing protein, partial [bacterium]|nr:SpoIID/LytB domain-containing protein [bacterium]
RSVTVRILERPSFTSLDVREGPGPWKRVLAGTDGMRVDGVRRSAYVLSGDGFSLRWGSFHRSYPGGLSVKVEDGSLALVNRVDLDDYVAGVAAAESGGRGPFEYRVALAWTARAFALRMTPRHKDADLCDLTHCQVYQGVAPDWNTWRAVALRAAGIRRPLPKWPLFTGSCGGLLDDPGAVWGEHPSRPGFPIVCSLNGEALCRGDPYFRWTRRLPRTEVEAALRDLGQVPAGSRLLSWAPLKRTPAGRALSFAYRLLTAQGIREGHVSASALNSAMGRRWGWNVWPSLSFTVKPLGTEDVYAGRGQGHGAGLCLAGAKALALRGWDATRILDFYFPPFQN